MESLLSYIALSREGGAGDEDVMSLTWLIWWLHQPLEVVGEYQSSMWLVPFSYHLSSLCQGRGFGHLLLTPEPYQVGTAIVSTCVGQGDERLIFSSLLLHVVAS